MLNRYLCIYVSQWSTLREDLWYFCDLQEHRKNRRFGSGDGVEETIYKELRSLKCLVDHTWLISNRNKTGPLCNLTSMVWQLRIDHPNIPAQAASAIEWAHEVESEWWWAGIEEGLRSEFDSNSLYTYIHTKANTF